MDLVLLLQVEILCCVEEVGIVTSDGNAILALV